MSLQKQCQDALFFAQNHRRVLHQQPELNWQEESTAGVDWCSHKPGVIHACGHDGHTAALLGTARWLKQHEDQLAQPVTLFSTCRRGRARGVGDDCGWSADGY